MIRTAKEFAKESYCKRRLVGAVLAKDGRILATGYNGTVSGKDNSCELIELSHGCGCRSTVSTVVAESEDMFSITCNCGTRHEYTKQYLLEQPLITSDFTLHAEQNVITFCAKEGISTNNATLYITHSPCKQCAKLISQSGIKRVVYSEEYKDLSGIEFLEECEIEIEFKDA